MRKFAFLLCAACSTTNPPEDASSDAGLEAEASTTHANG
jgi:hypothetical protein